MFRARAFAFRGALDLRSDCTRINGERRSIGHILQGSISRTNSAVFAVASASSWIHKRVEVHFHATEMRAHAAHHGLMDVNQLRQTAL